MTDTQILQIFGIVLAVIGAAWIINPREYKTTLKDIVANRGVLLIMGMFALIVGYLMVAVYDTYSNLVTFFGWLALVKGVVIIMMPSLIKDLYGALIRLRSYLVIMPWIVFVTGVILLYMGFFD